MKLEQVVWHEDGTFEAIESLCCRRRAQELVGYSAGDVLRGCDVERVCTDSEEWVCLVRDTTIGAFNKPASSCLQTGVYGSAICVRLLDWKKLEREKSCRACAKRLFDEEAFLETVGLWRPRGDTWSFIKFQLNQAERHTPSGEKRWTAKLVRETFKRLLPPGKTEREWCLDRAAEKGR